MILHLHLVIINLNYLGLDSNSRRPLLDCYLVTTTSSFVISVGVTLLPLTLTSIGFLLVVVVRFFSVGVTYSL